MRILYLHRTRSTDGQYVHIEALTRALEAIGHDVWICAPEGSGPAADLRKAFETNKEEPSKGFSVKSLPFGLYEAAEFAYSAPAFTKVRAAVSSFSPDFIYERYNLYFHAGAWAARLTGLPRLLEVNAPLAQERAKHGDLRWTGPAQTSERRLWTSADAVLPVTEVLGNMISARGVPQDRIHVIPNGVDDRILTSADATLVQNQYGLEDRLVLGFVGFVRPWHGVDRVIDWLASEAGRHAHLHVVGDGPAIPDLQQQAERLGISDRFTVTGVIERANIAPHIAAFDIALQPAVTAYASPLKLQEYMAQRRAILAPNQPNIRETVSHLKDAYLVPQDDPDAFVSGLNVLAQDPALRERLGAAAHQTLLDRDMTWEGNARRVTTLAQELITARR